MNIRKISNDVKEVVRLLSMNGKITGLLTNEEWKEIKTEAYDNIDELVRLAEIGKSIEEAFKNGCMLQVDDLYYVKDVEVLIDLKNSGKWKAV